MSLQRLYNGDRVDSHNVNNYNKNNNNATASKSLLTKNNWNLSYQLRGRRQLLERLLVDAVGDANGEHGDAGSLNPVYLTLKVRNSDGGPAVRDDDGHVVKTRSVSRLTKHLGPHF